MGQLRLGTAAVSAPPVQWRSGVLRALEQVGVFRQVPQQSCSRCRCVVIIRSKWGMETWGTTAAVSPWHLQGRVLQPAACWLFNLPP